MSKLAWSFVVMIGLSSLAVFTFTNADGEILILGTVICVAISIGERVRSR